MSLSPLDHHELELAAERVLMLVRNFAQEPLLWVDEGFVAEVSRMLAVRLGPEEAQAAVVMAQVVLDAARLHVQQAKHER